VSSSALGASRRWLSLRRHRAGRLDLFTMMATDVLNVLRSDIDVNDEARLNRFLARVRAWQDFMRAESDGPLSAEAEVGLYGELVVLEGLLAARVAAGIAVPAWKGPLDGLHDFALETGAVEVKTSTSPSGFAARIGSLEQLDDSLIRPLFVAAVRLALDASGETLTQCVSRVRDLLLNEMGTLTQFETLLLHAGYSALHADRYTRRFVRSSLRLFEVSDAFPRITRATVPLPVRTAVYEIDLDLVDAKSTTLESALSALGVSLEWS